jgi:serine/threonine-protein kinase RsbW
MQPLRVPARLEALAAIGAYVLQAAAAGGLDRRVAYRLRLAVDEIATNIIVHGRPGDGGDDHITVTAAVDDDSVRIVLEDAGPAFNPLEKEPPPDLARPMEERQIGGLGVYLAVESVDRFEYDRAEGVNRNTLVVHRRPPDAAPAV